MDDLLLGIVPVYFNELYIVCVSSVRLSMCLKVTSTEEFSGEFSLHFLQ